MNTRMTCQGPPLGVYTRGEAEALGRPGLIGHCKRGVDLDEAVDHETGEAVIDEETGAPVLIPVPCGTDLAPLIAEIPLDGKDHDLTCPKCQNVSRIKRLPQFPPEPLSPDS